VEKKLRVPFDRPLRVPSGSSAPREYEVQHAVLAQQTSRSLVTNGFSVNVSQVLDLISHRQYQDVRIQPTRLLDDSDQTRLFLSSPDEWNRFLLYIFSVALRPLSR
ncbi:hypothetical protein EV182_008412, partial [Spiromyces aspiralis]